MTRKTVCFFAAASLMAIAGTSNATIFTLEDGNSLARVDTNSIGGTRPGMDRWIIDGTNHLFSQWFWFRIGNQGPERRINDLPNQGEFTSNTNLDPRPDVLNIRYGDAIVRIDIRFGLQGGSAGSGSADISEQIRITNLTDAPLPLSFFQYSDFDLNSDILDDFVGILGPNVVRQSDFGSGSSVNETVVTPPANNWEVNVYPTTIFKLDDAFTDNLNGNAGPLVGAADYTWAFQWNVTIPARGSFLISKDKNITPTPGALALLGVAGLVATRRRR